MRNRRLLLLLGAVLVAAVVAGAAIAVGTRGGSEGETTTAAAPATAQHTTPALAGVAQRGLELGPASATVTLLEFADPQCPFCAEFSRDVVPTVVREYVRPGRIKLDFRPLHFIGPDSETAARAIVAAGFQGKAWNLIEELYAQQGAENSGWASQDNVEKIARGVKGLDVARLTRDMKSDKVSQALVDADTQSNQLGVRGTPTFFVIRPLAVAQQLQLSALDVDSFRAALDDALAG